MRHYRKTCKTSVIALINRACITPIVDRRYRCTYFFVRRHCDPSALLSGSPPPCSPCFLFPLSNRTLRFPACNCTKTPLKDHDLPFPSRTSEDNLEADARVSSAHSRAKTSSNVRSCASSGIITVSWTRDTAITGIESAMFQNIASSSNSHSRSDRTRILLDTTMHLQAGTRILSNITAASTIQDDAAIEYRSTESNRVESQFDVCRSNHRAWPISGFRERVSRRFGMAQDFPWRRAEFDVFLFRVLIWKLSREKHVSSSLRHARKLLWIKITSIAYKRYILGRE